MTEIVFIFGLLNRSGDMTASEIKPGTKLVDKDCGPCVARSKARRIAGGYVVDVVSPSPFGPGEPDYPWTACVCNLRLA